MNFLTKEDILNSDDLEVEEVKAWGGTVLVSSLTAAERDAFERVLLKDGKPTTDLTGIRAKLVSLTVINNKEEKKRVFTQEDVKALGEKSAKELDKVFSVSQKLSGLRNEDIEEITKNSNAQQE